MHGLGVAARQPAQLPDAVLTFGTPLDMDRFDVNAFLRLAAKFSFTYRTPLAKEVFNDARVREINAMWRDQVRSATLGKVAQVNVFGDEDNIAPVKGEKGADTAVQVRGSHSTILPKEADDCSFLILKAVIRDPKSVAGLSCLKKDPAQ